MDHLDHSEAEERPLQVFTNIYHSSRVWISLQFGEQSIYHANECFFPQGSVLVLQTMLTPFQCRQCSHHFNALNNARNLFRCKGGENVMKGCGILFSCRMDEVHAR